MAVSANCGPVLIADEDPTSRGDLARVLEAAGYEIVQVASGEEALQAVREVGPSIALLEIPLGSLSGYEVCRALREEDREMPVVFVSGSRTESYDRVAGLLVGADDYIVANGLRQDDIAERLFISRKTVGTHVGNILRKLGVRSQAQAVAVAYRGEFGDVVS